MLLYKLADTLGQSVEWVMNNVSILEIQGWAKYWEYLNDQSKRKR